MDLESIANYLNISEFCNSPIVFYFSRLFKTFSEFTKIVENLISPPVFKTANKVQIKFRKYDEENSVNYMYDLNTIVSQSK